MGYRKLKADKIFDGYRFIENHVLVISGEASIKEIITEENAGSDIEVFNGILCPGFINCHCHLELSHMKGRIPERTGLVDFVLRVVTERHFPLEKIYGAIEDAEKEMLQNGIVAVGDICNNNLTIPQKQKSRLFYYNFIEATGWQPSVFETRTENAKKLAEEFSTLHFPFSIVPHAPYSMSEALWQGIQPFFKNKVVSIHNQETVFEDEFFLKGSGDFLRLYERLNIDNTHHRPTKKSSIQSCFHKLSNADNIILVHNTFTNQQDVDFIKFKTSIPIAIGAKLQTFFCLCVNANQYIENSIPDIELFRKNNCTLVLGTDSLASNWNLNIMDEIKTIRKYFPSFSLEEILQWATINGAKALQLDEMLGSFEKGKKPGIILIDEYGLSAKRLA